MAMETIRMNYKEQFRLSVDYNRYRLLQIIRAYTDYMMNKNISKSNLSELWKHLHWWEKLCMDAPLPS